MANRSTIKAAHCTEKSINRDDCIAHLNTIFNSSKNGSKTEEKKILGISCKKKIRKNRGEQAKTGRQEPPKTERCKETSKEKGSQQVSKTASFKTFDKQNCELYITRQIGSYQLFAQLKNENQMNNIVNAINLIRQYYDKKKMHVATN